MVKFLVTLPRLNANFPTSPAPCKRLWKQGARSSYCWFASDVTAAMLGVKNKKRFSPLGNELYFDANFAQKFLLYWPPTWPPCYVVANQEYNTRVVEELARGRVYPFPLRCEVLARSPTLSTLYSTQVKRLPRRLLSHARPPPRHESSPPPHSRMEQATEIVRITLKKNQSDFTYLWVWGFTNTLEYT